MARLITGGGFGLGYADAGGGRATPIVFLHGVGSDKSVWRLQLAYFGRTRRAAAFDYPGYGESDPAPAGTTRDDYARTILAAMDALEIGRAHVCGLSLGGIVALALHHAAPARCVSLILADTFAVHPEGRAICARGVAASGNLGGAAEARVDVLLAQPADPAVRREVVETMAGIDPAAYRIGAEAVWLADQRQRAEQVDGPALVLVGEQDLVTPPELSHELADLIPEARLHVIRRAGHLTNLEQPEAFNAFVDAFIRDVDSRA